MYTLKVQNVAGHMLELTHSPDYRVEDIQGLSSPNATINTSVCGTFDGTRFNSSRVNERNIVLYLSFKRNVEENRIRLYQYFKAKQQVTLFYKNSIRDTYIKGYVDTIDYNPFSRHEVVQISIICPFPFFKKLSGTVVTMRPLQNLVEFPISIPERGIEFSSQGTNHGKAAIVNSGDVENGLIITLRATGPVTNPFVFNADTTKTFMLNYQMKAGDIIRIDTIRGERSVYLMNGIYGQQNLINSIAQNPDWLQVAPGDNTFAYSCVSGLEYLEVTLAYTDLYEGV